MRKTLFRQILSMQFLVISLCVFLLSTLFVTFFGRYMVDEKRNFLIEEVRYVNELSIFYQDNPSGATASLYRMGLNDIARRTGGIVFLTARDGEMIIGSDNAAQHMMGRLPDSYRARLFSGDQILLGDLNGFFKTTYLLVSTPLSYRGDTPAVSCIAVPMPEINRYRVDVIRTVLVSICFTLFFSFLLSFFISRRISIPLKNISIAAKSIMKGNFDIEVPVEGNTEIAELSETFNQMAFSLKKLEDMRDGFISGVSHELRTPMTTISGFIEGILDETIPKEKEHEYLSIVLGEARRLSRLVNELLLVARMEGGLELKKSVFDINERIRIALLRFEQTFSEKNIRPEFDFAADVTNVEADRDAIDRVLINLFDNALKFNEDGGYVRVSVAEKDAQVIVTVENGGAGISEEDLRMIWDKFYKTDKSRSQDKTGVGLGLYLVKNIIAAHGEKIRAESTPGEFTRFSFTLRKK